MMRKIIVAFLAVLFATSAFAQLPPGKWWRRPEVAQRLELTEDQQSRLDGIFRGAANDLIDLKAELDKQSIALRGELDQPQLNRANIRQIAARLNEARSRKFERELMMLVDMRAVLTDPQWNKMRATLERMAEEKMEGGQQPRAGGMRRRPMK